MISSAQTCAPKQSVGARDVRCSGRVCDARFMTINNFLSFAGPCKPGEVTIPQQVLLFGHLNFRECSPGDVPAVTTQFNSLRLSGEAVDQIFVAESLLEGARDTSQGRTMSLFEQEER